MPTNFEIDNITASSGNFTSSLQVNGTGVSISGHTHTASQISDSTTAGRTLLTGADASAQRTSLGLGSIATLSSGTYALVSHTHTSSDITNFNSSVSGLVSGIYAPLNGATFTGQITAPSGSFTNQVSIASNTITSGIALNIINSSNLYLWSNFR
jgi:hypothetical protein